MDQRIATASEEKYKQGEIHVNGGTIELINTIERPQKKQGGALPDISSFIRVYKLDNVPAQEDALLGFKEITRRGDKIVKVTSGSKTTVLTITEYNENGIVAISGKASFRALKKLGLHKHVLK